MTPARTVTQLLSTTVGILAHAVIAVASMAPENYTSSNIRWLDCSPNPSTQLKCANFSAPLKWSKPSGQQIKLALAIIPVANASQRIGYLMMNPGGLGGVPIKSDGTGDLGLGVTGDYWRSSQLHQYFDIVGPDPRGVELSSSLECDP